MVFVENTFPADNLEMGCRYNLGYLAVAYDDHSSWTTVLGRMLRGWRTLLCLLMCLIDVSRIIFLVGRTEMYSASTYVRFDSTDSKFSNSGCIATG